MKDGYTEEVGNMKSEQTKKDLMYLLLMFGILLLSVAACVCVCLFGE